MTSSITPHGGKLINRLLGASEQEKKLELARSLPKITLSARQQSDLDMIACGALSPLEGFMGEKDYLSVINTMRLTNGLPWTIPITLAVTEEEAKKIKIGNGVALVGATGRSPLLAILHLEEKYNAQRDLEAEKVYKTTDTAHPGVAAIKKEGEICLGGKVEVLNRVSYSDFLDSRKDPAELRTLFAGKKWRRIVAFQTRNPIHRAHEYLTKSALEICDGLLIHPIVGETKGDDIPADVRMRCYEVLIENYYPKDRVVLSVNPAAMRYAGPREAIFHALIRKNYGCTHFIVGRDHAGVGNYYGTFDAHFIFDEFKPEEIGITPLFFDHSFFCHKCEEMASNKTCPHGAESRVILSGTKVREMLAKGELPPQEFSRPEVARILIESMKRP
ncbi:MAG: sulfate adenylyltransferase [Deltaproteobacteria bacterium]|nr:sulfate adenylyltransferase [Deltaproteobacteria bacterium]